MEVRSLKLSQKALRYVRETEKLLSVPDAPAKLCWVPSVSPDTGYLRLDVEISTAATNDNSSVRVKIVFKEYESPMVHVSRFNRPYESLHIWMSFGKPVAVDVKVNEISDQLPRLLLPLMKIWPVDPLYENPSIGIPE